MSRRAFSLVESVGALVILGVAIPSMLLALGSAHAGRVNPVLASQARWLAVERLEDVIADHASPGRGWAYIDGANYPDESPVPGWPAFSRSVEVRETGPDLEGPGEGYKAVTVAVRWTHEGRDLQVRMATVLTELPE